MLRLQEESKRSLSRNSALKIPQKSTKKFFLQILTSVFCATIIVNDCSFDNLTAYGNETEKGMQCESVAARFTVMM